MNTKGSLLERLREQLADLESSQRATGGTAAAGFWSTPSPDAAEPAPSDAAEPAPGDTDPISPGAASSGSAGEEQPVREFPAPLTMHWANWSNVSGAYASGFAFAAASLDRPQMEPARMTEADLLELVTQLGAVQHHREVSLVRLVTQLEARGVASPGGLCRVDWLRTVDPTLTASAAKAVVTCGDAFNEPRWTQLREAVTGGTSGNTGTAARASQAERVTVGKAAQVIDFFHHLKPVADPDDLKQAVTHLTDQAPGLRWEQLAKLARELSDQVRPPKKADEHDQKRRDGRGLWFTSPNAAGMVGMTGTLDPEGAATLKAAIDPLAAPCPLTDEDGVRIEDDPRPPHQRRMDALLDLVARGVTAPGQAPSTDKAKIVVTINFEALRDFLAHGCPPDWATRGGGKGSAGKNGATGKGGSGSCLSGDVLSAAIVRRLACDAAIIPVVLGSDSQPLDVGREERLVTRAMRTPPSGSETKAAPSRAAPPPRSGPTPTTCGIGSTAAPPAWATSPCCAGDTTSTSTTSTSPRPSPPPGSRGTPGNTGAPASMSDADIGHSISSPVRRQRRGRSTVAARMDGSEVAHTGSRACSSCRGAPLVSNCVACRRA
ncbi:hypothetical protein BA895_15350 [Humibacillus sp. DSM 29435]|uniref:DUF222 domain-containing protein n=1 Tax=Humibacillus sp. DSM 29435 TaxID=1869167 RepID=UPI0008731AF6|nr:DUF222 domain-containing protein [Humibacillus sp. DSM 29435]OFE17619.1 hypothetical protein BA895_15350 [Humibacillus sp. DSM 29435]